jgi:hypothetical protein
MFVFSADSHIVEPPDLFTSGLPASLRPRAIQMALRDGFIMTVTGDRVIHRLRANKPLSAKTEGAPTSAARLGTRDLAGRLQDMEKDGVDAEVVFPSLALWTYDHALMLSRVRLSGEGGSLAEHPDAEIPALRTPYDP